MSYCFSTTLHSKEENQLNIQHLIPVLALLKELKTTKKTACIFLDFTKGFNIGNHEILLKQFHHYGVRGIALEWIQSYITNRLKVVKLWQYLSEFQTITC